MPKYSFIDETTPTIKGKEIIKDPGVGGIKLTYTIGDKYFFSSKSQPKRIYFIKFFKKNISSNKEQCERTYGKNSWGNTSSPFCNIWMKSDIDYTNFQKEYDNMNVDFFVGLTVVTDSELIKHLNNRDRMFDLSGQSKEPKKFSKLQNLKISITLINQNLKSWQKRNLKKVVVS
jgi:hypothetical protein